MTPPLLLNAFSLSMLGDADAASLRLRRLTVVEAAALAGGVVSAVGHDDVAALFESQLGVPVAVRRQSVQLAAGERALVGQYHGPRLPAGATTLPADAEIVWWLVERTE